MGCLLDLFILPLKICVGMICLPFYAMYFLFKPFIYLIYYPFLFVYEVLRVSFVYLWGVDTTNNKKHIKYSTAIDGRSFEYVSAEVLRQRGFTNIKVTKASGDQGADIIAYKNELKYAIQCKYFKSPVGNKAIQEVYAAKAYYNCDIAAVITNSTFTDSAKELAKKTNVELWDCSPISLSKNHAQGKKELRGTENRKRVVICLGIIVIIALIYTIFGYIKYVL